MGKLNSIAITKAKLPGYYGDGDGLWLQIAKGGSKSWVFRFTLHGKRREMGLGPLHTIGLADARKRAQECRLLVFDRIDPIDKRRLTHARDGITFDQCAEAYMDAHHSSWRNLKHAAQWSSTEDLCNARDRPAAGFRNRYCPRYARVAAHLENKDRDGLTPTRAY